MISPFSTQDCKLSTATPAGTVCPASRSRRRFLLWPLLAFLAFWAGTTASHAATAVITFTNMPSAVSNTYNGVITLQINGLTNGVTNVVVQKFLDVNTNGVIDRGDLLVQQFPLTVGQAPTFTNGTTTVTVTNFMPGDATTVTGLITAPLNFQNGDFAQTLAGQYLYKVSSPLGQFAPVTNLFTVTNFPFSTLLTGAVENASSPNYTNVPNAIVLLFNGQSSTLNVTAGTVANNAGYFALRVPAGTYFLAAAESNLVADLAQPLFTVYTNSTNNVTVTLTAATTNIVGRVSNATNNVVGVPGISGMLLSTNDFFSLYFTDTNGNFYAPVTSNFWVAPVDNFAAAFNGYVTWQTNLLLNVSNKVVGITNALPRATAIFYGSVSNNDVLKPMSGVYLVAFDALGHQSWAMTDAHGNYALGIIGGTNQWQLAVLAADNPGLTNAYVFAPGYVTTNLNPGQALQENFGLKMAPYNISGTVEDYNGNPIVGVEVYATATNNYQAFVATTASDGSYSINISPGVWTVGVNADSLESLGYTNIPATQTTNLFDGGDAVINFSLLVCGEIEILTTNLPDAMVGQYYDTNLEASACQSISNWSLAYGITLTSLYDQTNVTYPAGTKIYSSTALVGYLLSDFSYGFEKVPGAGDAAYTTNCTATELPDGNAVNFSDISATVTVSGPVASNTVLYIEGKSWVTTTTPTSESSGEYQTTIYRGSEDLFYQSKGPLNYNATNGAFMTGLSAPTNLEASLVGVFHSLTGGTSMNVASSIPYPGTNGATVWLLNGQNWGEYSIAAYGPENGSLPPGLTLYPDGTIAGTPTSAGTNGLFNFTVSAEDIASNSAVQTLSIFVYPATSLSTSSSLSTSALLSSNLFQMQINGVTAGLNYTVQMSTNLASTNWTTIFATNAPGTNALLVPDWNATNASRFYRVLVGQ